MASQNKKQLKSAFVLGLECQKFENFLNYQAYFQSKVETQKLHVYTSNQLALFKPQGMPRDQSMKEQYFQNLNFYLELDFQSLSRIFILIDMDEKDIADEIINCYVNRFYNYINYITLIFIEKQDTPYFQNKYIKNVNNIQDIIVCGQTQDISIQILNSCSIMYKPLEIQIKKLCPYRQNKNIKYIEYVLNVKQNPKQRIFSQEHIKTNEIFRSQLSPTQQEYQEIKSQESIWKKLRDMLCLSN